MSVLAFLSFGIAEILLVGVVALLVFGGELPDVMRNVGRSYARLRRSLQDLSRPVREEMNKLRDLPPAPDVAPPTRNPPVPEYMVDESAPDEPTAAPDPDMEDDTPRTRGVADEPPPV
jgi:sec-independent protein translocase protein TatA